MKDSKEKRTTRKPKETQAERTARLLREAKETQAPTISAQQAAAVLGVSDRTIARMCEKGKLKAVKVMSLWRINRAALFEMVGIEGEQAPSEINE